MALITGSNALNTDFTPAAGDFTVEVSGGAATLQAKAASGATFVTVGRIDNERRIVSNPVAGAIYRFQSGEAVTVRADQ